MSIKNRFYNFAYITVLGTGLFLLSVSSAYAGCAPGFQTQPDGATCIESAPAAGTCSPGIPCTGYDINTDTTSNTDPPLNGPKTGLPVTAGAHTGGACDGDFMNQIISRAYLEASRDVIMSEQIIRKPDSVLEYTCFEDLVNTTAIYGDRIFSGIQDGDTGDFVNRNTALLTESDDGEIDYSDYSCSTAPCVEYSVVFPDTQMDNILANVVLTPLNAYINHTAAANDGNFDHTYRGGSSALDSNVTNLDDPYNCTDMQSVWDEALCIDFGEEDQFRSFQQLAEADPRNLPVICEAGPAAANLGDNPAGGAVILATGNLIAFAAISEINIAFPIDYTEPCDLTDGQTPRTGITEDMIHASNNCGYTYSSFDIMETHFDIIKSPTITNSLGDAVSNEATGHPLQCSDPIPTGVPVVTYEKTLASPDGIDIYQTVRGLHYDHVCVNPGCHYVPNRVVWPWNVAAMPAVPTSGLCVAQLPP